MKYNSRKEFFTDLRNLDKSEIEDGIEYFTNLETDKYNSLVFAFIYFLKAGIHQAYEGLSYKRSENNIYFYEETGTSPVIEFEESFGVYASNGNIHSKVLKVENNAIIENRLEFFKIIAASFKTACNTLFLHKNIVANLKPVPAEREQKPQPQQAIKRTWEDLFIDKNDIERCLQVLRDLEKPAITADNIFMGRSGKGIFPLWIRVLSQHTPKALIRSFTDQEYKQILNDNIKDLNLSKDASEFRKLYTTLEKNNTKAELKALLASK